ncbi:glycosyltransferase [Dysgonomonas sp. 521]|uniref:glycosyltransferase n=1 Tax=Dysgonomonas sp. 521 TaxID=2302932 RepID=UPI0013D611E7|nr:glycosyltransferase [Dysgonomonas sp. 521]NDV95251.1 glycosyltransferase [Dysgonomonas sp. 521]
MVNNNKYKKLPISAIITGCNEGYLLGNCLKSISFCEDITYVDLESKDNSKQVAEKLGVKIIEHERVPMVEIIHEELYHKTKYDWILIIDPDEQVSPVLQNEIIEHFNNGIPDNIGAVLVPCIYYYKNHPLKGTRWGGVHSRMLLFHKDKCRMTGIVHAGRTVLPPYEPYWIPYNGENVDHHYWMINFSQLREKHLRYLEKEGESRNFMGFIASRKGIAKRPLKAFYSCFIKSKGYKDGFYGLLLSFFWAWYDTCAEIRLYKYQQHK